MLSDGSSCYIYVDEFGRIIKTENDLFLVSGLNDILLRVYVNTRIGSDVVAYASFKRADGYALTNRPMEIIGQAPLENDPDMRYDPDRQYYIFDFSFENQPRILDVEGSLEVSFNFKAMSSGFNLATISTTLLVRKNVKPNLTTTTEEEFYAEAIGIVEETQAQLNGHIVNYNNPHKVRADQVPLNDEDQTKISVLINDLQQSVATIEKDLQGLDNKVEKTDTNGVYAHKNGEDITIPTSIIGGKNSLVMTNDEGKFHVPEPLLDTHPTNKLYVDTKVNETKEYAEEKIAELEEGSNAYTDVKILEVNTSVEEKFTQLETNLPNKIKEQAVVKGFSTNYTKKSAVEGTDKIVIEDSSNETKYTQLQGLIDKIKGEVVDSQEETQVFVFDDRTALVNAITVSYDSSTLYTKIVSLTTPEGDVYTADKLKIGATFYLKDTAVPDYWLATKELYGQVENVNDYINFFFSIDTSGANINLDNYYNKNQIDALVDDFTTEEQITFTKSLGTTQALGGIAKGTNLSGKTSKEILDLLLFPYVAFSVSMSTTAAGGVKEVGTSYTVSTVTVYITMGSANISSITIKRGSMYLYTMAGEIEAGTTTITLPMPQTVNSNSTFSCTVTDSEGTSKSANATAFTFVYPYYYGAIDDGVTLTEALVKGLTKSVSSKGTKTVTITMDQQNALFAYPKSYGTISTILDANGFNVTDTFVVSELAMYDTTYYVYVLSQPATASMKYTFSY